MNFWSSDVIDTGVGDVMLMALSVTPLQHDIFGQVMPLAMADDTDASTGFSTGTQVIKYL